MRGCALELVDGHDSEERQKGRVHAGVAEYAHEGRKHEHQCLGLNTGEGEEVCDDNLLPG